MSLFNRLPFPLILVIALWITCLALPVDAAQPKLVTVAYQYGANPSKLAQAEGRYEKATGSKIVWKRFDNGADIATALASGDVDIGLVGSSPLAAFASRGLPVKAFVLSGVIGSSEALVVRDGSNILKPQDLAGKTIATPYVSTSHFSLLAALAHWQVNAQQVKIINLGPTEIIAAWKRGDIAAAYTWDPALSAIKQSGKVLTDSEEVGRWGSPTFEAWIVRNAFAEQYPEFVQAFADVTLAANLEYREYGHRWTPSSPQIQAIARISGSRAADLPQLLKGSRFPTAQEQLAAELLGNDKASGLARVLQSTADFLKAQKKIDRVLPDYRNIIDTKYVTQAAHSQGSKLSSASSMPNSLPKQARNDAFNTLAGPATSAAEAL